MIVVTNSAVVLDSPPPSLITYATYSRRVRKEDGEMGFEPQELFCKIGRNKYAFPIGLKDRVINSCKNEKVVDMSESKPKPNIANCNASWRAGQEEVFDAIVNNDRGIIEAAAAFGKSYVIGQLCLAYQGIVPVIVVTTKGTVLTQLMDEAIANGIDAVKVNARSRYVCGKEAYFVSSKSMHKMPKDIKAIMLYDEAHSSLGPQTMMELVSFVNIWAFGLSATMVRSDLPDKVFEIIFGKRLKTVSNSMAVSNGNIVQTTVVSIAFPNFRRAGMHSSIKEKIGITANHKRNELIAKVMSTVPEDEKAIIVCKTTEQVLRLKQLLPNWEAVSSSISADRWHVFQKAGLMPDDDMSEVPDSFEEDVLVEFTENEKTLYEDYYKKLKMVKKITSAVRAEMYEFLTDESIKDRSRKPYTHEQKNKLVNQMSAGLEDIYYEVYHSLVGFRNGFNLKEDVLKVIGSTSAHQSIADKMRIRDFYSKAAVEKRYKVFFDKKLRSFSKYATRSVEEMKQRLASTPGMKVISTQVFREGISIDDLAYTCLASGSGKVNCLQVAGRGTRVDPGDSTRGEKIHSIHVEIKDVTSGSGYEMSYCRNASARDKIYRDAKFDIVYAKSDIDLQSFKLRKTKMEN